ncbi:hypothetical protein G5647_03240 [Pectobacterium carotovorum]|uniref:hypothetical protein n=1 Tax=Pectobacterium carotovorum TaxID=554 RepID=UPI00191D907D|nr:hypothetical protein [Pectobacterium carotovorum]MBL0865418.1 hypothetical protein [Pectobacterium carotovorum]
MESPITNQLTIDEGIKGIIKDYTFFQIIGDGNYMTFTVVNDDGKEYPCFFEPVQINSSGAAALITLLNTSMIYGLTITAYGKKLSIDGAFKAITSIKIHPTD